MLFFTFLILGFVLFVVIYLYSIAQLKRQKSSQEILDSVDSQKSIASKIVNFFSRKKQAAFFGSSRDFGSLSKPILSNPTLNDNSDNGMVSIGGLVAKVTSATSTTSATSKETVVEPIIEPTIESVVQGKDSLNVKVMEKTDAKHIVKTDERSSENLISEKKAATATAEKVLGAAMNETAGESIDSVASEVSPSLDMTASDASSQNNNAFDRSDKQKQVIDIVDMAIYQDDVVSQDVADQQAISIENCHQVLVDDSLQSESVEGTVENNNDFYQSNKKSNSNNALFKASADEIEIVAKISSTSTVSRDVCLALYGRYDYLLTRRSGIFGRNSLTHVWENMELADQSAEFDDIAVSLQLADKSGAMTRKESNTFSTLAIELADRLDKNIVFSMDIDEAIEKGRMLDELARKYDAMVVCNIIPKRRKRFRSTDILSCTRDLKMVQTKNGVFGRFDEVDGVSSLRYSLAVANSDGKYLPVSSKESFQVEDIIIFLNVPLVKKPVEAFDLMIKDSRNLAAWLDGKVVDKNGRNMTSRILERLADQIIVIEKEMALDGLVPGTDLCKKLF